MSSDNGIVDQKEEKGREGNGMEAHRIPTDESDAWISVNERKDVTDIHPVIETTCLFDDDDNSIHRE